MTSEPEAPRTLAKLREASDADLVALHDNSSDDLEPTKKIYRDELVRRSQVRATESAHRLAHHTFTLALCSAVIGVGNAIGSVLSQFGWKEGQAGALIVTAFVVVLVLYIRHRAPY